MTPADLQIPERGSAPVEDPAVVAGREAKEAAAAFNTISESGAEPSPKFDAAQERTSKADDIYADAPVTSVAGALAKMEELRALLSPPEHDLDERNLDTRHFKTVVAFLEAVAGGKGAAIGNHPDAEIIDLWRQWSAIRDDLNRNSAECDVAREKLPKWARPGGPGEYGWPEIDTTQPPWKDDQSPWAGRKRPSLIEILKEHRFDADLYDRGGGDESRKEVLALGHARIHAWISRVCEQRTCRDRVGLTDLEAKGDVICDQQYDIEDRIADTPAQSPAGLVIKMRLYAHKEFGGPSIDGALPIEEAIDEDVAHLDGLLRSVLRDAERLAGV